MKKLEEILSKIPDVALFSSTISKDDLRLFVRLKPAHKRQYSKEEIMKIVDEYMGFYTPLVLVIAALVWAFTKDLNRVISVLVVSCPCAFILATPTAMVAALSAAAKSRCSAATSTSGSALA